MTRRVLLVDDNFDALETLAEVMMLWKHQVRTAQDGEEALKVAREFRPDVVILDIGLPGLNGYEVARRLRLPESGVSGAFIVGLSGYGLDSDLQRSREAGFDSYLVKPVELDVLEALLEEASAAAMPSAPSREQ